MLKINRLWIMQLHLLLACFIAPVLLLFIITGILFNFSIKGSYQTEEYPVHLSSPLTENLDSLREIASKALQSRGLDRPSGKAKLIDSDEEVAMEWRGAALSVSLFSTERPDSATLIVKQANWYRHLVQLHTSNGSIFFKVYAVMMASALFCLLVTGYIMALQGTKFRKLTVYASLSSLTVFALLWWLG